MTTNMKVFLVVATMLFANSVAAEDVEYCEKTFAEYKERKAQQPSFGKLFAASLVGQLANTHVHSYAGSVTINGERTHFRSSITHTDQYAARKTAAKIISTPSPGPSHHLLLENLYEENCHEVLGMTRRQMAFAKKENK